MTVGRPVKHLPLEFQWHEGIWRDLFDRQVTFIQREIMRALADNKLIVYLSCPISSRGGSYFVTNAEIANFTAGRLSAEWGPRFWFLNPVSYQMESEQGFDLMRMQAYELGIEKNTLIDFEELLRREPVGGGDYMRMWTRVLAEDGSNDVGSRIAAFYFVGPSDIAAFFNRTGAKDMTATVESYFASKCAADVQFRLYFSAPHEVDRDLGSPIGTGNLAQITDSREKEFFQFYTVRASAYFSKGSHDQWNIWRVLNSVRTLAGESDVNYRLPIAAYFDGRQLDPAAMEADTSPGYANIPGELTSRLQERSSLGARTNNRPTATAGDRFVAVQPPQQFQNVSTEVGGEDDSITIKQMYDDALAAFKREDLEAVLDHWEDDGAYLWPAVKPAIGKREIRAAYQAFFAQWTADERFYRHELIISGDLAYSRFGTELTLLPKAGGDRTKMTLQGVHVYRRNPTGWKFKAVIAINVPEGQF